MSMERLTKRIGENVYFTQGKYESTLPAECETQDVRNILHRLAAYEDTGLEPQLVQLLADAICGKTGVFCPVCGDGLCLAAGKNGLQIGCFGCGEYVPVKELFEVYRAMKERERTWNG